jgi:hypothetical protein
VGGVRAASKWRDDILFSCDEMKIICSSRTIDIPAGGECMCMSVLSVWSLAELAENGCGKRRFLSHVLIRRA